MAARFGVLVVPGLPQVVGEQDPPSGQPLPELEYGGVGPVLQQVLAQHQVYGRYPVCAEHVAGPEQG